MSRKQQQQQQPPPQQPWPSYDYQQGSYGGPSYGSPYGEVRTAGGYAAPQLFDDLSTQPPPYGGVPSGGGYPGYYSGPGPSFPASQFFQDPLVANMAMQYGQSVLGQGRQIVDQKLEQYVAVSKLKYYFAVDTAYVVKKLALLFFPFTHQDWSVRYNQDEPVAPRFEINAPDLYIPAMAFVTYILMAGVCLGTQNRFSPEQLGYLASSSLGWLALEVVIFLLTMYIMNIRTDLSYFDLTSYCGYKYVGMIWSLCGSIVFPIMGYSVSLIYASVSLSFFLVQTLRVQVLPKADASDMATGNKRRMYLLLSIASLQPIMMFFLTRRLVSSGT